MKYKNVIFLILCFIKIYFVKINAAFLWNNDKVNLIIEKFFKTDNLDIKLDLFDDFTIFLKKEIYEDFSRFEKICFDKFANDYSKDLLYAYMMFLI